MILPSSFLADAKTGRLADDMWRVSHLDWSSGERALGAAATFPFAQAAILAVGVRYRRPGSSPPWMLKYFNTDMRDPELFRRKYTNSPGIPLLGGEWRNGSYWHQGTEYSAQTINNLEHFFLSAEARALGGQWLATSRAWLWDIAVEWVSSGGKADTEQYEQYDKTGIAFATAHNL